jgi:hypothetical protein
MEYHQNRHGNQKLTDLFVNLHASLKGVCSYILTYAPLQTFQIHIQLNKNIHLV